MEEQTLYQAPAGWLKSAVEALRAAGARVIAPVEVEPGVVDLAPVESAETITLKYINVESPIKRFFLPMTEVLLEFEKREGGDVEVRSQPLPSAGEVVVMGCRPCDVAALETLDAVFQWDYDDVRYRARRERTTLVTFACSKPGPACFCTSVGGAPDDAGASDVLAFLGEGGEAILRVNTVKGQKFIARLGAGVHAAAPGTVNPAPVNLEPKFDPEKVKRWLDANFENAFWAEKSLKCLGCGACSYRCPTCHCFDIVDESSWNRGERRRNWDSCSFGLFTMHASGHNPRPDQASRLRQRLMHKFKYFPERFGRIACVGCGRCITTCGVGQNLVANLIEIESEEGARSVKA